MKDINAVFAECMAELEEIGIVPEPITSVTVNYRAKKRWGQAKKHGDGTHEISISCRLCEDTAPDWPIRNTMIHEILHCVEGCKGHKGKWLRLAKKCNSQLGTKIQRCSDYNGEIEEIPLEEYPYVFKCKTCGQIVGRTRMSKFVRQYQDYHCGICHHGKFERIR